MKDRILDKIENIPEADYASLIMVASTLTNDITSYFCLGVDEEYSEALREFRLHSLKLLNAYETPDTYQKDDIYWLLYWATEDTSLQTTYNGYNYLHLLLEPPVQNLLTKINLKEYLHCIVQLIKPTNLNHIRGN